MAMLEVNHLSIQFGGLRAVDGFNMTIEKGQLYGLIGPNGAGKTTVFNLLTGVYKPDSRELSVWMARTLPEKALLRSTRPELPEPSRISVCFKELTVFWIMLK